ncbi:MAG: bifunctional oligoribonuclease/PAP phosphatase NrnA [Phycisphaerae bacterium]|nr:bifunctional oligoribonuclease/PAP phosphatase NrnA [Phycisphaerae bacterium]
MDEPVSLDIEATAARLDAASRIVVTTHARADGDAIGSAAAVQRVLRQRGKVVTAYLHEEALERYVFLAEWEPLAVWDVATAAGVLADADLIVIVDTCSVDQLRAMADVIKAAAVPRLAIDHHVTRDNIVDAILADERAGACAQIITRLCEHAGWPLDAKTASLLYTGLATDTGWFRFSNADSAVYATASRLIDAGARPNELYERLYLSDCEARARLVGAVLSSFELHADGRLAVIRLTRELIARCGATHDMTEDVINEPQRIGSVVACVLFIEPPADGYIRVSLRSKRGVDVAEMASRFGGGGHQRAAGVRITGTMDSVTKQVIPAMIEAVRSAT